MKSFKVISSILKENDYLGPRDRFQPEPGEKTFFKIDDVSHIEDSRTFMKWENLDPRGVLYITNMRVFYQPKFFTVGKMTNTIIPLDDISNVEYEISKLVNRRLIIYHGPEYKEDIFWTTFFKLKDAYKVLTDLLAKR